VPVSALRSAKEGSAARGTCPAARPPRSVLEHLTRPKMRSSHEVDVDNKEFKRELEKAEKEFAAS
jgi:hypothetical protein